MQQLDVMTSEILDAQPKEPQSPLKKEPNPLVSIPPNFTEEFPSTN